MTFFIESKYMSYYNIEMGKIVPNICFLHLKLRKTSKNNEEIQINKICIFERNLQYVIKNKNNFLFATFRKITEKEF